MKARSSSAGCEATSGPQLEPGGRPPAPGPLALVQRFVNTWNRDFPVESDQLRDAHAATTWLQENGLIGDVAEPSVLTIDEVDMLRDLREAIRGLASANVTGSPDPAELRTINDAAAAAPISFITRDDGGIVIRAGSRGSQHAIGTLLAIIHDAQIAGDWARLKGCRECAYAFYDQSKNRSATWCAMSVCGNRAKNRAYHQRRRERT